MKYSSGNNHRGKGQNVNRESRQHWLIRRVIAEAHKARLLLTEDADLSARELQEKALVQRIWTVRELQAFIGLSAS